jgi:uncharacterized protein YfaP (DUF2135 family)
MQPAVPEPEDSAQLIPTPVAGHEPALFSRTSDSHSIHSVYVNYFKRYYDFCDSNKYIFCSL